MLLGIQLLGVLFALMMIYFAYVFYRRKSFGLKSFLGWLIIWVVFMSLALFPSSLYGVMDALSVQRTADFVTMFAIAIFAVVLFYMYAMTKSTEQKVEKLVRALAIERAQKSTKKPVKKSTKKAKKSTKR